MNEQTRPPMLSKVGWLITALPAIPLALATFGLLITNDPQNAFILEAPVAFVAGALHALGVCLVYGLVMSIVPALVFTRLGSRPIPQGPGPRLRVSLRWLIPVFIAAAAFNLGLDFWSHPDAVIAVVRGNPIGTPRFEGWLMGALPLTMGWMALSVRSQRRRLIAAAAPARLTG